MLGRLGQAGVDRLGARGAAGHGADQKRCLQPSPQKVDAQIDARMIQVRQSLVHEPPVVEPRRQGVTPAAGQHHVKVLVFATQDQGRGGGVVRFAQGCRSVIRT